MPGLGHRMKFDFSSLPLRNGGFSDQTMSILDLEPRAMLTTITEMALLETGSPAARAHWQKTQLRNLLAHAGQRSAFWQKRIGSANAELAALPLLTRRDVQQQVALEGCLLRENDGLATHPHATSGSTGTPVRFFVSEVNGRYNGARSLAQFFMEGRDLSLNRTRFKLVQMPDPERLTIEKSESWLGPLAGLIRSGGNKYIEYLRPNIQALIRELEKDDIGYLVCPPRIMEMIFSSCDPTLLRRAKLHMWLPLAESVAPELIKIFADLAIPVRASYSCEEVGAIGYQCAALPDHYHVATSNVIVEVVDRKYDIDGAMFGKVLVTHLHSYATPFIRYDLGDLACLREDCPCGHQGPTISHLQGRLTELLHHRDGRLSPFYIRGQDLAAHARFTEYRMRQTEFDKIVIELGGRSELAAEEIAALTEFLKTRAGPEFDIEVKACAEIDWGESSKRRGFRCEVA